MSEVGERISPLEPYELPQVAVDAANAFLESDQYTLRELLAIPDLTQLQAKITILIPEAQRVLLKSNIRSGVASRAFVDAVVRRWVAAHPTEKSPE